MPSLQSTSSLGVVIRQGLLYKRPQKRTGKLNFTSAMKRRQFVLTDSSLSYYEYDEEKRQPGRLKGYIPIDRIRGVRATVAADGKDTPYFEVMQCQLSLVEYIFTPSK